VTATGVGVGDHATSGPEAVAGIRDKYRLAGDYILCVGTLEPRRHHHKVVQAYHRFAEMTQGAPQLVIVGKPGNAYQALLNEIAERGLRDRVHVLREVDRAELSALYSGALFVVYPSIYEGFRLPLLDALAYRKPVVTLRNSIMSELAGDAALAVDPEDSEEIAEGFTRLAGDAQYRVELIRRGEARRDAAHQWPTIARVVLDRLRALAG
jgi:glycosyltransferase involved in cell wall biosynthesis